VRTLRRGGGALLQVPGRAERAPEVEALDRAVAHAEGDVAAGRRDVVDDLAAAAREIDVEAARAADVRGAARQRLDQRREIDVRGLAREREAGLVARRTHAEAAVETAAVKPRASVLEREVAVADEDARAD